MNNAAPESVVDSGVIDAPAPGVPTSDSDATENVSPAEPVIATSPTDEESSQGVLQQVEQKRRNRRRRRGTPPGWTLWVAKHAGRSKTLFSHTFPYWLMSHREELVSYVASFAFLGIVALLMAMWALPASTTEGLFGLIVTRAEADLEELDVAKLEDMIQPESIKELEVNSSLKQMISNLEDGDTSIEITSPLDKEFAFDLEPTEAEMDSMFKKGDFGGRSDAGRQTAVKQYGGTAESEKAVNSGLKWLKGIQQKDGSWNFTNVGPGASAGRFGRTEVGATSLALLCYLGAGHTHVDESPYRETVERGLAYIGSQVEVIQGTADLRGQYQGNAGMYVQGIATICISEAHALVRRDKDLEKLTGMAVSFIERSQDPIEGGWRYAPRESGDTSVVGWQLMALQSAKVGRVKVSTKCIRAVREFLRAAQGDEDGSTYKYRPQDNAQKNSMTAVGLLCRMYLGWNKGHEPLEKGVHRLSTIGPSRTDMYYNYYATQVLHHWGDDLWKKWNLTMREQLVRTQVNDGPATGSWAPTDSHGSSGGQLYQTALSVLTLEVYYRHLPIYQRLENGPEDPTEVD